MVNLMNGYQNQNNWNPNPSYTPTPSIPVQDTAHFSQQPSAGNHPPVMQGWNGASPQPRTPKKKNSSGTAKLAVVAALSVAFSFGAGFLGTSLANSLDTDPAPVQSQQQNIPSNTEGIATNANTSSGKTEMSTQEVAALVKDSVVEITTESVTTGNFFQQQIMSGAGSGVIISSDGYIVTNHHVIDGSSKITVTLTDGISYEAALIGSDKKTDLAVLKINAEGLKPAVYGSSSSLQVGEPAIVVGNPLGQLGGSVSNGIISALDRQITVDNEVMSLLQTNAAVNPGNSGGGLFNAQGELVGIINAKSSGENVEGIGFAIPIDTARTVIDDLLTYGYVQGRVELGLSLLDVSDPQTALMYGVHSTGVYVLKINEGSAAERAGIQVGDRIISADGTAITTSSELKQILDSHSVGDQLELTIIRGNRQGTVQITLGENKGESI